MQVINNSSYQLIAFGWHKSVGYGEEVVIDPGASVDVKIPSIKFIGEMNGEESLQGISCQETRDDTNGFHVSRGKKLVLALGEQGVTIRHHLDETDRPS